MIKTKKCKHCGKEFTTDCNSKVYCSRACQKKNAKKKSQPKLEQYNCDWCGASFLAYRKRKYCCTDCRLYANGRKDLPEAKKRNQPVKSLAEINALARAEGLTYGEYFKKYGYGKEDGFRGIQKN